MALKWFKRASDFIGTCEPEKEKEKRQVWKRTDKMQSTVPPPAGSLGYCYQDVTNSHCEGWSWIFDSVGLLTRLIQIFPSMHFTP